MEIISQYSSKIEDKILSDRCMYVCIKFHVIKSLSSFAESRGSRMVKEHREIGEHASTYWSISN